MYKVIDLDADCASVLLSCWSARFRGPSLIHTALHLHPFYLQTHSALYILTFLSALLPSRGRSVAQIFGDS